MGMDERYASTTCNLAVDEACTNVMDYAYQGSAGQPVTVECTRKTASASSSSAIAAVPSIQSRVPMPDLKAPLSRRRIGGLGIYLMRKLMDDVRFSFRPARTAIELTLVKAIKPQGRRATRTASYVLIRARLRHM